MRILLIALVAVLGMEKRDQQAAEKLQAAKEAYRSALARTNDFDCVAPEFDEVLKLLDAVPRMTPSKREAKDLARQIREKRKAKAKHAQALDAAPVPKPITDIDVGGAKIVAEGSPADPATCKSAKARMRTLAAARRSAGKPPLGTVAFTNAGEVAYAPGAEPSAEESNLLETLRNCH